MRFSSVPGLQPAWDIRLGGIAGETSSNPMGRLSCHRALAANRLIYLAKASLEPRPINTVPMIASIGLRSRLSEKRSSLGISETD
jgi:hypothetical protein